MGIQSDIQDLIDSCDDALQRKELGHVGRWLRTLMSTEIADAVQAGDCGRLCTRFLLHELPPWHQGERDPLSPDEREQFLQFGLTHLERGVDASIPGLPRDDWCRMLAFGHLVALLRSRWSDDPESSRIVGEAQTREQWEHHRRQAEEMARLAHELCPSDGRNRWIAEVADSVGTLLLARSCGDWDEAVKALSYAGDLTVGHDWLRTALKIKAANYMGPAFDSGNHIAAGQLADLSIRLFLTPAGAAEWDKADDRLEVGDLEGADAQFARVLDHEPRWKHDHVRNYIGGAYGWRSLNLDESENLPLALGLREREIVYFPDAWNTWYHLGRLLYAAYGSQLTGKLREGEPIGTRAEVFARSMSSLHKAVDLIESQDEPGEADPEEGRPYSLLAIEYLQVMRGMVPLAEVRAAIPVSDQPGASPLDADREWRPWLGRRAVAYAKKALELAKGSEHERNMAELIDPVAAAFPDEFEGRVVPPSQTDAWGAHTWQKRGSPAQAISEARTPASLSDRVRKPLLLTEAALRFLWLQLRICAIRAKLGKEYASLGRKTAELLGEGAIDHPQLSGEQQRIMILEAELNRKRAELYIAS